MTIKKVWGIMLMLSLLFIPTVQGLQGSFSFTDPNYFWLTDGSTYISEDCSWNILTLTSTMFDFTNFYWNPSGVTWTYFGFSCDTLGESMNITGLTLNTVTVSPSANNTSGKIFAGGMSHVISVAGASYSWDNAVKVVSFTSDGSPDVVITFGISDVTPTIPPVIISNNFGYLLALFIIILIVIFFLLTR